GVEAGAAGGLMVVRTVMEDLITMLRDLKRDGEPLLRDPVVRDRLVQFLMEEKALVLGERRAAIPALSLDYPFSLQLSGKLRSSEFSREMRKFAVEMQGARGSLYVGDKNALAGGFWQRAYFNNFSTTIGGGTSQVQANIVGERVLGLPKD
ncbi:MAG: acyl-CoA dehydrogenase family protein, partial [Gammaproteobacteria bacterium]|nr:acyl-CoA dehydrogenase family protein [Gammaproteobacteria bacterium]